MLTQVGCLDTLQRLQILRLNKGELPVTSGPWLWELKGSEVALTSEQLKKYWDTANVLRKNLDAAEYKHIVLG